jgi:hypothetical protein
MAGRSDGEPVAQNDELLWNLWCSARVLAIDECIDTVNARVHSLFADNRIHDSADAMRWSLAAAQAVTRGACRLDTPARSLAFPIHVRILKSDSSPSFAGKEAPRREVQFCIATKRLTASVRAKFVGAALGWLFGTMLGFVFPTISAPAAYLIVGMGCFLAATTRAP